MVIFGSCQSDLEPNYREISGLWKLDEASLNGKNYLNSDLAKFDLIQIPYTKIKRKYRDNQSVFSGLFIVNDSTKNLDFPNKKFKGYKIKYSGNIEFRYFNPDFGSDNIQNDLLNKIFIGNWNYKVDSKQLILIRNKILTDTLGGLKMVYKKID